MTTPIEIREDAGIRTLHFGSEWVQGAMRIARPWNLELEYTREMLASLLLIEEPRKVLQIGLGAASLTRFLYHYYPQMQLTVVEIEPIVIAAARQYFKLPEDPVRMHLLTGCGAEYMLASTKKFNLILVDGFDQHARAGPLETLPFYQACRTRLTDDGVLAVNLLTHSYRASLGRIMQAFEDRALLFPSCESGNAIAFATAGNTIDLSLEQLKENALALKTQTGLNLLPTLSRLAQAKSCLNNRLVL